MKRPATKNYKVTVAYIINKNKERNLKQGEV